MPRLFAIILDANDEEARAIADLLRAPDLAPLRAVLLALNPPTWYESLTLPFSCGAKDKAQALRWYSAPALDAAYRDVITPWPMRVINRQGEFLQVNARPVIWVRGVDVSPLPE